MSSRLATRRQLGKGFGTCVVCFGKGDSAREPGSKGDFDDERAGAGHGGIALRAARCSLRGLSFWVRSFEGEPTQLKLVQVVARSVRAPDSELSRGVDLRSLAEESWERSSTRSLFNFV